MEDQIRKSQAEFDEKFGCYQNRKEKVGKHSNYSYQSFLDWHNQQEITLLEVIKKWAEEKKQKGTSTHGTCCTCQNCRFDYDNCKCEYNKPLEDLTKFLDKAINKYK